MDPLTMGLISGGSNLLGSVFSSMTSASNTNQQLAAQQNMMMQSEQFNAGQAQLQRDYQTQMSNTAYQRASADMKAAGLNPMMMFGSGGAASTPSGAGASVGTPSAPSPSRTSPLAGIGPAVNSAVNAAVEAKTVDKMAEEIANLRATRGLTIAETGTEGMRKDVAAQTAAAIAQGRTIKTPAEIEAQAVSQLGSSVLGTAGKVKYLAGAASDVLQPIINSATGVGRVGQAFQDIAASKLRGKLSRGNFEATYGTPIDEYVAH